tara:strand:+ start:496 stop:972 length:477 start_codon:yes stop_codon:yes gene_type:complete
MTHQDAEEFGSAPNEPHDPQGRPVKGKLKTYEVTFSTTLTVEAENEESIDTEDLQMSIDQGDVGVDDIQEVQEGQAITELNFGDGFNENNSIAIIWCTQDIHSAIDDMDLDWTPTKEQSLEILSWIKNKHDASVGVSWETLYIYIQTFYDEIQESDNE